MAQGLRFVLNPAALHTYMDLPRASEVYASKAFLQAALGWCLMKTESGRENALIMVFLWANAGNKVRKSCVVFGVKVLVFVEVLFFVLFLPSYGRCFLRVKIDFDHPFPFRKPFLLWAGLLFAILLLVLQNLPRISVTLGREKFPGPCDIVQL